MDTISLRQGHDFFDFPCKHRTTGGTFAVADNRKGNARLRNIPRRENSYLVIHVESGLMLPRPSETILNLRAAIEYAQFAEDAETFDPNTGRVIAKDRTAAIVALRTWAPSKEKTTAGS